MDFSVEKMKDVLQENVAEIPPGPGTVDEMLSASFQILKDLLHR